MFSFETLIYGCLMFIVRLHCCQNLTMPNVPTRRLLPGNPTTAALVAFVILFRRIDPISQNVQQWLLGARNWITVITERSDHSLVTYWGLNFCWWLFTTFWYVISKNTKSHVFFEIWKKRKIRILEHWSVLVTCWPMISFFSDIIETYGTSLFYGVFCGSDDFLFWEHFHLVVLTGGNCNSRESWFVSRCESRVTRVTGQKVWPIVISVQDILYSSRLQTLLNLL